MSFYKFKRKQLVKAATDIRGIISSGVNGQIISVRGIEGVPQYLVKFNGKSGHVHCEEGELETR